MKGYREIFVAIAAHHWEPMVQFYEYILEQSPKPYIPKSYAEFKADGLKLGLFLPKADHQSEFSQPSQSAISLCLEVGNLIHSFSKIDAAYNDLRRIGYVEPKEHIRYGEIMTASHGQECYAYDPDGNRLILHVGVPG
ncbi:MAG: VOC family protein [Cyanobacteria bacterium P01_F01_bin.150]